MNNAFGVPGHSNDVQDIASREFGLVASEQIACSCISTISAVAS